MSEKKKRKKKWIVARLIRKRIGRGKNDGANQSLCSKGGSHETLDNLRQGSAKYVNFFLRPLPSLLFKKAFAPALTDVH